MDNVLKYLDNSNFEEFEKSVENYLIEKKTMSIEEKKANYEKFKVALAKKMAEVSSDVDLYKKIIEYVKLYLNKKEYDNPKFWKIIGQNFYKLKMYDEAIAYYTKCLNYEHCDKDLYRQIGDIYYFEKKDDKKALPLYLKFIEFVKDNDKVYNMIGHLYEKIYKSEYVSEQLRYFEMAHNLAPEKKEYIVNLFLVSGKNKEIGTFCKSVDYILKHSPTHQEKFDIACWSLYNKIYKNMHKYYHSRFFKEKGATEYPDINNKLWTGQEDLKDKTLLVRFEQGYGDSIAFVRFLPLLKNIAPNFIFKVQKELVSLFSYNYPDYKIIPNDDIETPDYDYQIPLMDLFSFFKITDKTMPQKKGYLTVSEEKSSNFANKHLQTNKFKIGIAYKGNQSYLGDNRDIPEEILIKLTELENVQIYSLQVSNKEKLFSLPASNKIIDLTPYLDNFEQTAAAMKGMDLILSTDNVLLNLAGAMGLKTFGMFNYYPDFRWFTLKGNNTGWYSSIKVFKAKHYDDWEELFNRVIDEIKNISVEKI